MSAITAPKGFVAGGIHAGLKASGKLDRTPIKASPVRDMKAAEIGKNMTLCGDVRLVPNSKKADCHSGNWSRCSDPCDQKFARCLSVVDPYPQYHFVHERCWPCMFRGETLDESVVYVVLQSV